MTPPAPSSATRRSPLALAVLSLLAYRPLHPYGVQRLLKEWGKDNVVNVGQRAGLYKTMERLLAAGLIAVRETGRDQQYPERTVYELTDEGRETGEQWLQEILSVPRNEFPEFPAALSFLMLLGREAALAALEQRQARLTETLAVLRKAVEESKGYGLPRVTLLDDEYAVVMTAAELTWVTGIVEDLRDGSLEWSRAELEAFAAPEQDDRGEIES
jgi:DNA-binding PadR family transcriptional regulator